MKKSKYATDEWKELIERAKLSGREKAVDMAAELFQAAYDLSRNFDANDLRRGESAYYLAYTRYVQDKPLVASGLFEEAVQSLPKDSDEGRARISQIYSILGAIYFGEKNFKEAERCLNMSLKMAEKFGFPSWENEQILASVLFAQEKFEESIPLFERILERQKRSGSKEVLKTISILAFLCGKSGREAQEIAWQKESLRLRGLKSSPRGFQVMPKPDSLPLGWGTDSLTHFIDASQQNEFANYANHRQLCERVINVSERFWLTRENLTIPMAKLLGTSANLENFADIQVEAADWLELYFFMRCHASYLGAARLALSSQIPEACMILRGCLENAMYAFFVRGNETRKMIWLNREQNEKEVRKLFKVATIREELNRANMNLGNRVSQLYNDVIGEGAHPNVQAFFKNSLQVNAAGEINLAVSYLNPGHAESTLKKVEEIGAITLDIFGLVFPYLVEELKNSN